MRVLLVIVVVAAIALGVLGMRRGWRNRAARQAWLGELPAVPELACEHPLAGLYVATTTAGDWLDRIAVHGLGNRCRAQLCLMPDGALLRREGEADLWLDRDAIRDVRLDRGLAQKVFEAGGVIVITWQLGSALLDTGFRADDPQEHVAAARELASLRESGPGSDLPAPQLATPDRTSTDPTSTDPAGADPAGADPAVADRPSADRRNR